MDMSRNKLHELTEDKGAWCATIHEVPKIQIWLVTEQQHKFLYIDNSKELVKKRTWINNFSEMEGYKINMQKSVVSYTIKMNCLKRK